MLSGWGTGQVARREVAGRRRRAQADADRALRASGYQPAWRRLWDRLFHRQRQ